MCETGSLLVWLMRGFLDCSVAPITASDVFKQPEDVILKSKGPRVDHKIMLCCFKTHCPLVSVIQENYWMQKCFCQIRITEKEEETSCFPHSRESQGWYASTKNTACGRDHRPVHTHLHTIINDTDWGSKLKADHSFCFFKQKHPPCCIFGAHRKWLLHTWLMRLHLSSCVVKTDVCLCWVLTC